MALDETTFGWVLSPSTPSSLLEVYGDPTALSKALLDANQTFIEALPDAFDTLWVEDHFQWDNNPTLEVFTTMTHYAALYPKRRMGSIVLGQSYRNPALTAKMAATLQLLTDGRFILGLGAGWKEDEYLAYGYPFPGAGTRIEELEDTVRIVKAMFSQSPASYHGRHYQIENAYCEPRPNPPIPLLIGGGGEKKTLRVVAEHADMWNWAFRTPEVFAAKQAVLAEHCRAVGRDPNEIVHTYYAWIDLSDAQEAAAKSPNMHILSGTPQSVAAELRAFGALGVRHVMIRFTDFPSTVGLERFSKEVLPALGR